MLKVANPKFFAKAYIVRQNSQKLPICGKLKCRKINLQNFLLFLTISQLSFVFFLWEKNEFLRQLKDDGAMN